MRDDLGAFAQRAKADDYPTHTFLVLFGATHDADSLVEVHVVVSEKWLVTVHTESCPAFVSLRSEREDVLSEVLRLRRRLVGVRRVLGPQRDLACAGSPPSPRSSCRSRS